jgi:hypothetical protein
MLSRRLLVDQRPLRQLPDFGHEAGRILQQGDFAISKPRATPDRSGILVRRAIGIEAPEIGLDRQPSSSSGWDAADTLLQQVERRTSRLVSRDVLKVSFRVIRPNQVCSSLALNPVPPAVFGTPD